MYMAYTNIHISLRSVRLDAHFLLCVQHSYLATHGYRDTFLVIFFWGGGLLAFDIAGLKIPVKQKKLGK